MNATKARVENHWATFLSFYSKQYSGRATRLGLFETADGVVNDLWIEDGLPLSDIYMADKASKPIIYITLGGYTHSIQNVTSLRVHYSLERDQDGIDIVTEEGKTTVLRFENGHVG